MSLRSIRNIFYSINQLGFSTLYKHSRWQCKKQFSICASIRLNKQPNQYEYDPQTDSFRPKTLNRIQNNSFNRSHDNNDSNNQSSGKKYSKLINRFLRNLFLITGGVVWVGVVIVTLFVDEEPEIDLRLADMEEHVRLLVFYDVLTTKQNAIWKILHGKDVPLPDIHPPEMKLKVFNEAIHYVKQNRDIIGYLGKPIQFCGFLAAKKVSTLIEDYGNLSKNVENITKHGKMDSQSAETLEEETKKYWKAECILDSPKGLALLSLDFESKMEVEEWKLKRVSLHKLGVQQQDLFVEESSNGINLIT